MHADTDHSGTAPASVRVSLPPRAQLLDELRAESATTVGVQPITLVLAPTGYGKTATVAEWLGTDASETFPARWVHCSPHLPDSPWPEIARLLAPFSAEEEVTGVDSVGTALALATHLHSPVTLVVDDYHHATNPHSDLALAELAEASPRLSLVLIARRVDLLDGAVVGARTRIRTIGVDRLRLTPDETAALTAELGVPDSPNLRTALERADGWPLAIRAALSLGSDTLYTAGPTGRRWRGAEGEAHFDPLAQLNAFAIGSLQVLAPAAHALLLAAAQIDSLSSAQARELVAEPEAADTDALNTLVELGFLERSRPFPSEEYRCHRSIRTPIAEHGAGSIGPVERQRLFRGRAAEVAGTAPFTAFRLYCAAQDFAAAEHTLANNFTTITDEVEECTELLRTLPEAVLFAYPTLAAALLFLETPRTEVAPSRLRYLIVGWQRGLRARLPEGAFGEPGPIHLQLVCQAMVASRILGALDQAKQLMQFLESRAPAGGVIAAPEGTGHDVALAVVTARGSMPTYLKEVAATALAVGDFRRARRTLKRLRALSHRAMTATWHGFPHASTRTVSDTESGARWYLASLSELALADTIDGHVRRSGELLYEYDELVAASGLQAPGIAWVGAEVARSLLAEESGNRPLLEQAQGRLATLSDRIEPWPLLLIAETASLRQRRGAEVALAHLSAGLTTGASLAPAPQAWTAFVVAFEAMLHTCVGNLARTEPLLEQLSPTSATARLERARLAVFSGREVDALLLVRGVGDPEATKRQRVDRCLLTAVAAWGCEQHAEAIAALTTAASLIDKYFLPAMLVSVPFDLLRAVAVQARSTGACDIVGAIDEIPEIARAHRYEQLTDMELRTLRAIAEHRNANKAAASLFITAGTVKKHLASVYRKLRVRDRDAAILRAGQMGLFEAAPEAQP